MFAPIGFMRTPAQPGVQYIEATGGIVTQDGDYKVHTFNFNSTFTITQTGTNNDIEYLVLGGGAGGSGGQAGSHYGAGGAGGIVRTGTKSDATATGYSVTVGDGGVFGPFNSGAGGTGGNSSIFGVTATGGRGPVYTTQTGGDNDDFSGGSNNGIALNSGGGAGAAANGGVVTGTGVDQGGIGGDGVTSAIDGTSKMYGAGGSGGYQTTAPEGAGASTNGVGENGVDGRGGGGGGGVNGQAGGNGGDGVVIVRYLSPGGATRDDIPPHSPYSFYDATNTTYSSATKAEDVVSFGADTDKNFTQGTVGYTSGQYWEFNSNTLGLDASATTSDFLSNMGGNEHTIVTLFYPEASNEEDILGNGTATGAILMMLYQGNKYRGHAWNQSALLTDDVEKTVTLGAWSVMAQALYVSGGTGDLKVWGGTTGDVTSAQITGVFSSSSNGPSLLKMGGRGNYQGRIGQIAIYNTSLTDGQVQEVYEWMIAHQGL